MKNNLSRINKRINEDRRIMEALANRYGLRDPLVVAQSQLLDKQILEWYKKNRVCPKGKIKVRSKKKGNDVNATLPMDATAESLHDPTLVAGLSL